jgi:hypothetical protein
VQVHEEIRLGGTIQRAVHHMLGLCPVTNTKEGVGEPTREPAVPG